MIAPPKIVVTYVYPKAGNAGFREKAERFVRTYQQFPPGIDHETLIVCNGAQPDPVTQALFTPCQRPQFITHDNSGWDLGAFQKASRIRADADFMLFCGSYTYLRRPGWLARMQHAFEDYGQALYGSTGHQGDMRYGVYPHIRTTAFWCSPLLMNDYPYPVNQSITGGQRYAMEHGSTCISEWVKSIGLERWIIGFDCERGLHNCDSMPNGYHQGDQSNLLVGDRLTEPPFHHCA